MRRFLRFEEGDRGSAMVAALAVALVGISLATVVVGRAIIVTRDAGRDAVRTAEIHAAEAALDASLMALEGGYPCPGPDFSGTTIGTGADAVLVSVEIEYWDEDVDLTSCVDGQIVGVPTGATVTATATPIQTQFGVSPERSFEMTLLLEPRMQENHGAAIFAASYLFTGAGLTLLPGDGGEFGDIWVGDGDYTCHTKVYIEGSLYVPEGSIYFNNNTCQVAGDVWTEGVFEVNNAKGVTVGGSVTVEAGNFVSRAKAIRVNGDVTLGGVLVESGPTPGFDIGGIVTQNAVVPDLGKVTLPVINFDPADWVADGFTVLDEDAWANYIVAQAKLNGEMTQPWQETNYRTHPCALEQSEVGKKPLKMPGTPTVFDLRYCANYSAADIGLLSNNQSVELPLYADTAFIIRGWQDRGSVTITSGDGLPHKVYIIVPYEYGTGLIETHTGSNIMPPIEVFLYSPGEVIFHNDSYTHGQVYGENVEVHSGAYFYYTPADIPGVSLTVQPTEDGSNVIIVNKREVG